jgi:hypothetical protein
LLDLTVSLIENNIVKTAQIGKVLSQHTGVDALVNISEFKSKLVSLYKRAFVHYVVFDALDQKSRATERLRIHKNKKIKEINMPTIFLSHRKPDAALAERLAHELEAAGHQAWFDEWKIDIGDSIVERINQGLEGMVYLVLCYSSSGMSPWVDREWMSTLARQLNGYPVKILPVMLSGGSVPAILADIKYADLISDWDKGVQALLRAIK